MSNPGSVAIAIDHNFETAHRLPLLGGKCTSLHGHSWHATITFRIPSWDMGMDKEGISVEYGLLKRVVRGWIDEYLDHGCMLGVRDPLLIELLLEDSKVFAFGDLDELEIAVAQRGHKEGVLPAQDRNYAEMPWPTVESVARMVCEKIQGQVNAAFAGPGLHVDSVLITETATNSALWIPEGLVKEPYDGYDARAHAERIP